MAINAGEGMPTGRAGGKLINITAGQIATATGAIQRIKGNDTVWMSPGQPLQALVPSAAGRQFDYPVATNLNISPRPNEPVSFWDLRQLADAYYMVRLAVETRKDQLVKLKWDFQPFDPKAKPDARCEMLSKFFKKPDAHSNWQDWIRQLVEDMLVIDAPAVYYRETYGNQPYAFEIMDGATIKVLVDGDGRKPQGDNPAFQQILKGVPAVNYTQKELVYKPRNPRSWKFYGYSPVEQIITIVNIGLRREMSQLQFYTEGNIPEALISTPATWNPDQVQTYQKYWDSLFEGNTANRRHAKFIPGGMTVHETKSATLTDAFDEWLARVVMYCFSLPSSAFTKQTNRATAETAKEQAEEEGLAPLMIWIEDFINYLVETYWGYDDIGFTWTEEKSIDPLIQAQINQIYIVTDVMDKNEVRATLGLDARDYEQEAADALEAQQAIMAASQPPQNPVKEGQVQQLPDDGKNPPNANPKTVKAHNHSHDVKKKSYGQLSPTNKKRAKSLAGSFKKFFASFKDDVISQVIAAYDGSDKVEKAKASASSITGKLEGAEVRWVLDGKVYARPSVTDLLVEADEALKKPGEMEAYRHDARIQVGVGFARVRDLLAGTADYEPAREAMKGGADGTAVVKSEPHLALYEHEWEVWPHYDRDYDYLTTDDDTEAWGAAVQALENQWDQLEPGESATVTIARRIKPTAAPGVGT